MERGGRRVPTRLRIQLTGVQGVTPAITVVRIGGIQIGGASILSAATLIAPGVYTMDFQLPSTLNRAGDQPIVITISVDGRLYETRLDDTASRVFIL